MAEANVTAEQVKDAIAATNADTKGQWPGEFKLGDGTVVKADTWEQAFQKVGEMKVNTAQALRDREEQIRQRDLMIDQIQHRGQGEDKKDHAAPVNGFDQKAYWELMNSNPLAAQNYLDAFRLGVEDPENVPRMFNEIRNVSVQSADNFELQSFMQRNPDWPGTNAAADLLINRLAERNAPLTADGLEYEYLKAVRNGDIEPLGEEAPRTFVPPNLGSGASLSREESNVMEQIRNTPDDKLDDVYRKLGLLK